MEPSRSNRPNHFALVKRLREDIEGAQIESFRPQALIRQPRSHDEKRRSGQTSYLLQHFSPRTGLQIALTNDDGNLLLP
jgi:hypothetical protein